MFYPAEHLLVSPVGPIELCSVLGGVQIGTDAEIAGLFDSRLHCKTLQCAPSPLGTPLDDQLRRYDKQGQPEKQSKMQPWWDGAQVDLQGLLQTLVDQDGEP